MKKIGLFMIPMLTDGGGDKKYFIDMARNLSEIPGISIDIITLDKPSYIIFARLMNIALYGNIFGKVIINENESRDSIAKLLNKSKWIQTSFLETSKTLQNYDLIYSKNEIVDLLLLKFCNYKKLPPIIVGIHTPLFFNNPKSLFSKLHNFIYLGPIYKWLLNGVRLIHASNQFTKEIVEKKFNLPCELIPYPFSINEIKKKSLKFIYQKKIVTNIFNIIFIGRLTEQKGIDDLVYISEKLNQYGKVIQINIFGSGDDINTNKILEVQKKYSYIKYYGHVENIFIPNILSKHDLLISTSKWEVLPFNILEAQSMGLPVISYDIPGPNDIILNNKTGFLVNSKIEFVEKILPLISKKTKFSKNSIFANINNKYNPKNIYKKIYQMFRSVN